MSFLADKSSLYFNKKIDFKVNKKPKKNIIEAANKDKFNSLM